MANMTGFSPEVAAQQLATFKEYGDNVYSIALRATSNFNTALYDSWCSPRANEWPPMPQDDQNVLDAAYVGGAYTYWAHDLREANENGVVGMNVSNVKLARGIYLDEMTKVTEQMWETPMDIAFYDPDGAQQAAYKAEIQKIVTELSESLSSAMTAIDNAMETEENTILLAKNEAASTMSA